MNPPPEREAAIFNAARKLPPEERALYLDGACAGAADLRQRVEELLRANDAADGFLQELATNSRQPTQFPTHFNAGATMQISFAQPEKPGDRIGHYKLLQQIGEGGCGVVYMAEQEEPVRRRVALKVIKLGMDTKSVIARFEAERQALALMDHPNIAKVFDAGATETGRPYFVMELVKGIPITRFCDENHLSTGVRLSLFVQVCQAIQHAHQKGIIHRDVKPSNILVTDHDGVPVPKIIDFGIAKATTDQRLTDKTLFTAFEQFIGTPAYMSPEQAKMSGLDIDTRSDIYSLGVLLYELLTGKTPFDSKALLQLGLDEMRRTIREQEPVRPSTRLSTMLEGELTTVARHRQSDSPRLLTLLRGDLDWIVMKALEKDRSRRYETANGLAMDIQRHLNNEPVVARPPSAAYRFQKAFRRNRLMFAAAIAVVIALVVGLGIAAVGLRHAMMERNNALAARAAEEAQRHQAQQAQANEAQLRREAEAQGLAARRSAYAADMFIAQQAYAAGNYGQVIKLLDRHRPDKTKSLNSRPPDDLRGWEWRYLWQLTLGNENFILGRHTISAYAVAFSPLGRLLASAGEDKTLRLWDLDTRREKTATLLPGFITVGAFGYSPDGAFLATGTSSSAGRRLTIWNGATLEQQRTLDPTNCLYFAFSPNGAFLAAGAGNELKLWETGTWRARAGWRSDKKVVREVRFRLPEEVNVEVSIVAVATDSRTVAFATDDGQIHLWDAESRQHTAEWPAHEPNPNLAFLLMRALVFSPDGRTLVSAGVDGQIKVWDVRTQEQRTNLTDQVAGQAEFWPEQLAFSPDGTTLAASGDDHTLRLWDTATWRLINVLKGHRGNVFGVAFSPDGKTLASASRDETIRLWNPVATAAENPFHKFPDDILGATLSTGGRYIGMAHRTGNLSLHDTATMRKLGEWPGLEFAGFEAAALSPDGSRAAFSFSDGSMRLAETVELKSVASWPAHAYSAVLCFSDDTSLLASFGADQTVRLWEVASHQERWTASLSNGVASSAIAISAHDELLCMGDLGGWVRVWDIRTGKQIQSFEAHKEPISCLAVSADGRTLITGSADGTAKIWFLRAANQTPTTLLASYSGVCGVALSPDARRLAVATWEDTVKVWDLATYREIATFRGHNPASTVLAFLPDGNTLAFLGRDGIYVWRAPSLAEIEAAEARLGKDGQSP